MVIFGVRRIKVARLLSQSNKQMTWQKKKSMEMTKSPEK